MTTYRVICTNQEPASQPPQHAHIVAIGVGTTADHYSQRFSCVLNHSEGGFQIRYPSLPKKFGL